MLAILFVHGIILIWLTICFNQPMKVEFEATPQELKSLIEILKGRPKFEEIRNHLITAAQVNDDSQSGEVSKEGDNEIIEREE